MEPFRVYFRPVDRCGRDQGKRLRDAASVADAFRRVREELRRECVRGIIEPGAYVLTVYGAGWDPALCETVVLTRYRSAHGVGVSE